MFVQFRIKLAITLHVQRDEMYKMLEFWVLYVLLRILFQINGKGLMCVYYICKIAKKGGLMCVHV